MQGLKKCCQCFFCSYTACCVAQCIDCWWSSKAYGMSQVYFQGCCWTFCSPVCMECHFGEQAPSKENCMKCLKYLGFSCALCCVGPVDGCYNCYSAIVTSCGDGIRRFKDLTEHSSHFGKRIYAAMGLPEDNEPYESMETTFAP